MYNFNQLPPEVILEIFGFLKPWDRQNAALVCKMWRNVTQCSRFYNCAVFRGQKSIESARAMWTKDAFHPFTTVEFESIEEFPDDFDEIWLDLGKTVSTLTFSECDGMNSEALRKILQHMPNAKTVDLLTFNRQCLGDLKQYFPSVTVLKLKFYNYYKLQQIQDLSLTKSFPNLQHLLLDNFWLYLELTSAENYNPAHNVYAVAFKHLLKKFASASTAKITICDNLFFNEISDQSLVEVCDMPNVKIQSIAFKTRMPNMHRMHNLLHHKGSEVTDLSIAGAEFLKFSDYTSIEKSCAKLEKIVLHFRRKTNRQTEYSIEFVKNFQALHTVVIKFHVDYQYLEPLLYRQTDPELRLPKIKHFYLAGFQIDAYNKEFQLLLEALPNLIDLQIRGCRIDKNNFQSIEQHCPKLRNLSLVVRNVPRDLLKLKHFNNLIHLEELKIDCIIKTVLDSLEMLALPKLRFIYLKNVCNLTPQKAHQISKNCPNLEEMCLYSCKLIEENIEEFKQLLLPDWKLVPCSEFEVRIGIQGFIWRNIRKMGTSLFANKIFNSLGGIELINL